MIVFDRAHFDHMTAGDAGVQSEVAALFCGQAEALAQGCAGEGWRAAVHTLKGSARGIGLHVLAEACAAAESAPEAERPAALKRVARALAEALVALRPVLAAPVR